MEELFRKIALSQCRRNASAVTTSGLDAGGRLADANVTCDGTNKDVLGLPYDAEFDVLRNPAVAAVVVVAYVVVIIVGTLGSLLVFMSVVSTRQMWTATNVFIANLALTDLVVCAFDLPLSLHYQVTYVCYNNIFVHRHAKSKAKQGENQSNLFATQKAECNITTERSRQDTKAVQITLTGALQIQIKTTIKTALQRKIKFGKIGHSLFVASMPAKLITNRSFQPSERLQYFRKYTIHYV